MPSDNAMKIHPIQAFGNPNSVSAMPIRTVTPRNPMVYKPKILARLMILSLLSDAVLDVQLVHEVGVYCDLDDKDRQRSLSCHIVAKRKSQERELVEPSRPDAGDEVG